MTKTEYAYIVFDGPPGPQSGRFVEVENDRGEGIRVGDWLEQPDGMWALRIRTVIGCPTCEGDGRYAWGDQKVPLELGPNECDTCGGSGDA